MKNLFQSTYHTILLTGIIFLSLILPFSIYADEIPIDKPSLRDKPLAGVKTEDPRDTMRTFMYSMNEYRQARLDHDFNRASEAISKATRTLNLDDIPFLLRKEKGEESAVFLKEAIDRVIVIDYDRIPDSSSEEKVLRWRLKDTEITILREESGERSGEYLFSKETVFRSKEFYERVSHLPYLNGSGNGALYEPPFVETAVPNWSKEMYLSLAIWQWVGIMISFFVGLTFRFIAKSILNILYNLASNSRTEWDHKIIGAITPAVGYIICTGFWYFSLHFLKLEGFPLNALTLILQLLLSFYIIWFLYSLSNVFSDYLTGKEEDGSSNAMNKQISNLVIRTIKSFIVVFGVLITIQSMGVNVMSLLAGLGIGGLAFALAAKDTAANLFGSIMILIDRPFKVGDWVKIGNSEGTVEEVGLRSTRIRTFYDSVISIPNMDMATTAIDNLGQRNYRRILAHIGITYGTATSKITAFVDGIKRIIQENPHTRKENYHVVFNRFSDYNLEIMIYCFLKVPDWSMELKVREQIYLDVIQLAENLGVEFAFPTHTVHVDSLPAQRGFLVNSPNV